jgi:quercetin dioxygenase-like cupin family protein
MKIVAGSERGCRKAPAEWFTGDVWVDDIVTAAAPLRLQAVYVTFSPGARTAWHTHPVGQVLQVVSGLGWVQLEGEAARVIRPGDVAVIGPGENHWHGAEAGHTMVHLAMHEPDESGKSVVWGRKVTDEEYRAAG